MKNKNPLYVVKGKTVEEAKGVFDLVLKKLNLEPVFQFLLELMKTLLSEVKSYPMLVAAKTMLDEVLAKLMPFVLNFSAR